MELFNKYNNIAFTFFTNYINNYIVNNDVIEQVTLEEQIMNINLFEEFKDALLNKNNSLNLFKNNSPKLNKPLDIIVSNGEIEWLQYVLQDPKSKLFFEKQQIDFLLDKIQGENLIKKNVDIREFYEEEEITDLMVKNFRKAIKSLETKSYCKIKIQKKDVTGAKELKGIIHRIEFSDFYNEFKFLFYTDKIEFISLKNIISLEIKESCDLNLRKKVSEYLEKNIEPPIHLKISKKTNAHDRASYLFYKYNKENSYEENYIHMHISYYSFQKNELMKKILFLGQYVEVISPEDIRNEIIIELLKIRNEYI